MYRNIPIGPILTLVFVISQAFRDVYFSHTLKYANYFDVLIIAFPLITAISFSVCLFRRTRWFELVVKNKSDFAMINACTSILWIGYFFGLTILAPTTVNILFVTSMLLSTVAIQNSHFPISKALVSVKEEYSYYYGLILIFFLIFVFSLFANSRLEQDWNIVFFALCAVAICGFFGAVGTLFERRLNEKGASPELVLATRFVGLIMLSVAYRSGEFTFSFIEFWSSSSWILFPVLVLVVIPIWIAQMAVSITSPITFKLILALSPSIVFVLQLLQGTIQSSLFMSPILVLFTICVLGGNMSRGWKSDFS